LDKQKPNQVNVTKLFCHQSGSLIIFKVKICIIDCIVGLVMGILDSLFWGYFDSCFTNFHNGQWYKQCAVCH
jgi:hypothetical protein